MRLLLLGGTGQVGCELLTLDRPEGVDVIAPPPEALDVTDRKAIADAIAAEPWSAVINGAAYTDVDRAESEQATAFAVNAEAAAQLASQTARRGIPLIHISTDYVFDGRKGAPYVETDRPAPLNFYGASKLAGERAVAAGNPRHIILRTAWVFSPHGRNFVKTILRLAGERDRLSIVNDQRGCPTAARDIAVLCRDMALACARGPQNVPFGVYHYCGEGETTWFGFAKAILAMASGRGARAPLLVPVTTADYPTPAARPRDSRLDCTAVTRAFGARQRPWREALAQTLARLLPDGRRA